MPTSNAPYWKTPAFVALRTSRKASLRSSKNANPYGKEKSRICHRVTEFTEKIKQMSEPAQSPLTEQIIGCAIEVHRRLGPGLLESVYESALCIEPEHCGLKFQSQLALPIKYRDRSIGELRIDIVVEKFGDS